MDKVLDKELDKIIGGSSVSGTLLNAFTTIIKFIYEFVTNFFAHRNLFKRILIKLTNNNYKELFI